MYHKITDEEILQRPHGKLGLLIRKLRKMHDMTAKRLADVIGCNYTLIAHIENGDRSPTKKQAACISDVFQHDIDEIAVLAGFVPEDIRHEMVKSVKNIKKCRKALGLRNDAVVEE
jgi:transcriptional regulator with XRE-family HTH domain